MRKLRGMVSLLLDYDNGPCERRSRDCSQQCLWLAVAGIARNGPLAAFRGAKLTFLTRDDRRQAAVNERRQPLRSRLLVSVFRFSRCSILFSPGSRGCRLPLLSGANLF